MRSAYNTDLNTESERVFLIHLVSEYLLSTYHVASIALVVEDTPVNKTDGTPALMELIFNFY